MGAPPESEREAIPGFDCLHRVAQSYLGSLWIASDGAGAVRLVRRIALPDGTKAEARRELVALGRHAIALEHPNVLAVLDVVEDGDLLAFAYEQVEAEPLRSLQSWANLRGLSFPVGVALRIMVDLLQGVAAMHALEQRSSGLRIAGGLSPDSVLISRSGGTQLCDPLIANGAAAIEGIGFNTAKLAYAAPEQVRAGARLSPAVDLFTCGAMLWELLASRRLLAGSRPAIERKLLEHNLPGLRASLRGAEKVSDALVALVEQSLSADAADRPPSASELADRLGACGHALATPAEVAAFVGKLSGPRFDRAAAAVRSRAGGDAKPAPASRAGATLLGVPAIGHAPASDVDTPRGDPFGPSTRRGVAEDVIDADDDDGPTETAALPPISLDRPLAPRPAPASSAGAPSARAESAQVGSVARGPARWEAVPAKKAPPSAPSQLAPFGSRTMMGLGGPDQPALAAGAPASNLARDPFAEAMGQEPEPSTESTPTGEEPTDTDVVALDEIDPGAPWHGEVGRGAGLAERPRSINPFELSVPPGAAVAAEEGAPLPFQHLLPHSKRASRPPSNDPGSSQRWFELHASQNGARASLLAKYKVVGIGVGLAAIFAFGSWLALTPRGGSGPSAAATSERPATTDAPAPMEGSPAPAPPAAAPAPPVADSGAPASAASAPAPAPSSDAAPTARAADFAAAKLDDSQLVVLFALEGRKTLPVCAEPLGGKRTPTDARRARQQLESAQQKLAAGDALAAYELACGAAANTPGNVAAQNVAVQRLIAELALELGDTARAKAAVDKALARAPKDKALIALRGDVLAMMGDIGASRAAWLRAAPGRGSMAARTKKLAQSSKKLGDKALAASQHGQAAAYYRRAVILTRGAYVQSFGLSEALLGMGRTQAALLWAERATQALPKDSRWHVLFGDALYQSGQGDRARGAWKAALDAQPGNRVAARRVREGKPE